MVNDIKETLEKLGIKHTSDELALIGLGALLASGSKPVVTPAEIVQKITPEIEILKNEIVKDDVVVYPGIHADKYEALMLRVGKNRIKCEILRPPYTINDKDEESYLEWREGKMIVIRGKTDFGGWKSKNFLIKDNKLTVMCWGSTHQNKKRHKFSEEEAKEVASKIENSKVYLNEENNTWKMLIDNNTKEIIKAWLILWNQI
jgi:hypothetical protein